MDIFHPLPVTSANAMSFAYLNAFLTECVLPLSILGRFVRVFTTTLAIALFLGRVPSLAAASAPPVLRDQAFWVDETGRCTIQEISSLDAGGSKHFRPVSRHYAGGYARGVHWLRFTIEAPAGECWLEVLPPYLDDLQLYEREPAAPDGFRVRRAGDLLPFSLREVPYRGFVFKLQQTAAGPEVYYLRLQTTSTAALLLRVWEPEAFLRQMPGQYALLFALLGGLLTLIVLSSVSWYVLRDRLFFLFLCSEIAQFVALPTITGLVAQFFFPERPDLTNWGVGASVYLGYITYAFFYSRLFAITSRQWLAHWLFRLLGIVCTVGLVGQPLGVFRPLMAAAQMLMTATVVISIPLVWRLWRQQTPGGAFLLAAAGWQMVGLLAASLFTLGVTIGDGYAMLHGPLVGALGAIFMSHLAVSARFNSLRDSRVRAEQAAEQERALRRRQQLFIDKLAHDYRTPLAAITLSIAGMEAAKDEGQRRASGERIREAIRVLIRLLDGALLTGDRGIAPPIGAPTLDLEELLHKAKESRLGLPPGSMRRVHLDSAGPVFVAADARVLEAALSLLLDNAAKYSPPDSTIDLRLANEGSRVTVVVGNFCATGIRYDAVGLGGKGVRGPNSGGIEGAGMGLYLAAKLVAEQHGKMSLRLELAGRFEVSLSFATSATHASHAPTA
jgi:signal transduction histidine kinase